MKQRELSDELDDFVGDVEEALDETLRGAAPDASRPSPILLGAARHLTLADAAKRSRPRLVARLGRLFGLDAKMCVDIAVAAELMHAASLLHDDVIDEGDVRRGRPTANTRWSNTVAVLGGDIVLCLALGRLRRHPPILTFEGIDTVTRMTTGVMEEVEARHHLEWSLPAWRRIAEGKTGVLLGWCAASCARLAGMAHATVEAYRDIGVRLGVAFQLADDLLDFRPADTAKTGFADLRNRNPSFPIIWAMERDPRLAADIRGVLVAESPTDMDLSTVARAITSAGAVAAGVEVIQAEMDVVVETLARGASDAVAESITGWARDLLARVADAFPSFTGDAA